MKKFSVIILCLLFFVSCGKLKGEFAFQAPEDKTYKRNPGRLEFDSGQEIKWIYSFTSIPMGRTKLGVIILKKELGWVDILTTSDYIDSLKKVVYGTLKELEPGDYKIVLVELTSDGNKKIDEKEVYIYSDEEILD